ncbi:UNVERIFIED_ORG: CPBP family intramembrane metalloprotease (plasmid) [Roseateles sp. XES5]|nr:CPBP family intramembrane glutamic endopeptidase [Roseateles sp. XES5]
MASRQDALEAPEYPDDLPFYDGRPVAIASWGWLAVVAAVPLAFFILSVSGPVASTQAAALLPTFLFAGLPLAALALAAGRHWTALFRPYGPKAFGVSLLFALATLAVSGVVALALQILVPMQPNPILAALAQMGAAETALFFARTIVQLVGEEVATILPLLAILWFAHERLGLSRRVGLALGIVLSTVWFSAMHLPTYDWNPLQCFGIIGSSRLVLTAAYVLTRNLWVSAGAHILNDWSLFVLSLAIPDEA